LGGDRSWSGRSVFVNGLFSQSASTPIREETS
jgi:hypothetical protein